VTRSAAQLRAEIDSLREYVACQSAQLVELRRQRVLLETKLGAARKENRRLRAWWQALQAIAEPDVD